MEILYISFGIGVLYIYCIGYIILGNVNVEKKWKNGLKIILWLWGKSFIEKDLKYRMLFILLIMWVNF